ncbi:homoserine dehydrogenase [Bacillus sp. Marseille-P3800]|uniref:homoserine dehydrogenase n=1 Tax=Bacillus sp. Marseille-P3800 TaxID=2014782 RepID=UPI000C0861AA|nr:homoserine dehydrogenase [Bacillus sp. Marseille-P3800]
MERAIQIGLLGLGTVGTGVASIIKQHQETLSHQIGRPIEIKRAFVKDLHKSREPWLSSLELTEDVNAIIQDPSIDVVIEVMGGIDETYQYVERALKEKKHVITANKDLMAEYGSTLLHKANDLHCDLFYEASVAGGIPIIRTITDGLSADKLTKVMGIVNGTTNYMLTKMTEEKRTFDDVLDEAQTLGYAEADPTADVDGLDAARKMAILATLAFSTQVHISDVSVKGIRTVSDIDLSYCEQFGYTMKLIGLAQKDEGQLEVRVEPTLLPNTHPLANVHNEYNAVLVEGEAMGESMYYGPGAGSLPTATAVVSDLVTVAKNIQRRVHGMSYQTPMFQTTFKQENEIQSPYFIRLHVYDRAGTFAAITTLFAQHDVSFERLIQLPLADQQEQAEVVLITHTTTVAIIKELVAKLKQLEAVADVASYYRVEQKG